MYSPKISEELIPALYQRAKTMRMPMTKLVDILIRQALVTMERPQASDNDHDASTTQASA